MDTYQALRAFWRLRLLVAIGMIVALVAGLSVKFHISVSPPKLTSRSSTTGAAQSEFYVDNGRSILTARSSGGGSLVFSAQVAAHLIGSGDIRRMIAREMNLPVAAISVTGPFSTVPASQSAPTAQQRAESVLGGGPYSIYVTNDQSLPTVNVFTQAPTVAGAIRLADVTAQQTATYLAQRRRREAPGLARAFDDALAVRRKQLKRSLTGAERREARRDFFGDSIVVRQAGNAVGGPVASQVRNLLVFVTFFGVLAVWCVALLLLVRLREVIRVGRSG